MMPSAIIDVSYFYPTEQLCRIKRGGVGEMNESQTAMKAHTVEGQTMSNQAKTLVIEVVDIQGHAS
jgi:hypothetical protein